VPLSEDEQRILQQIERRFYANDRRSAERIESTTLPRYLARNCRWSALAFIVGLVILLVSFASNWVVGVVGLAIMLAGAIGFTQNVRRMGKHSWQQLSATLRSRDVTDTIENARRRFRRRLGGDD
jgi:hypothetical protein